MKNINQIRNRIIIITIFRRLILTINITAIYHVFYFFINVNELISIKTEKFFLLIYIFIPVIQFILFLSDIIKKLSQKNLIFILEEHFNTDFSIINEYEIHNNTNLQGSNTIKTIKLNQLYPIFVKKSLVTIFSILLSFLLIFHLFQFKKTKVFFKNCTAVISSNKKYPINLEYPDQIIAHNNLKINYTGFFNKITLRVYGQSFNNFYDLTNNQIFILSNVNDSIFIRAHGKQGRIETYTSVQNIKVIKYPDIKNINTTVIDPIFNKKILIAGSTEINALPQSSITTVISVNENKVISNGIFFNENKSIKGRCSSNTITFQIKPNTSEKYKLILFDTYNLTNKQALVINYHIQANNAPEININLPAKNLEIKKKIDIPVQFTAIDDLGLRKVIFDSEIIPSYSKEPIYKTNFIAAQTRQKNLEKTVILKLTDYELYPGNKVNYYLTVYDYYGLTSKSKTYSVTYNSFAQMYDKTKSMQEQIESYLKKSKSSMAEIKKNIKNLKNKPVLNKNDLNTLDAQKKKLEQLQKNFQQSTENLDNSIENARENQLFSEEIIQKIQQIKNQLRQMDSSILRNAKSNMDKIMNSLDISKKDVQQYLNDFSTEKFSEQLDDVLKSLETLKEYQNFSFLNQMAQRIKDKHKDLTSFYMAEDNFQNFEKHQKEISSELKELKQKFEDFKKTNPQLDDESQQMMDELNQELTDEFIEDYEEFKLEEDQNNNLNNLNEFEKKLESISQKFSFFENRNKEMDHDRIIKEINYQISGFSTQADHILTENKIKQLEIFDKIINNYKNQFAAFLSEINSFTERSKKQLYDITAGYIPGIISFFEYYDVLIEENNYLKSKINPSSGNKDAVSEVIFSEIDNTAQDYLLLCKRLIILKQQVKQDKMSSSMMNSMQSLGSQQSKQNQRMENMMQQGMQNLSSSQKEYLKQLAMNQQMIRSLLEQLQKGTGQGMQQQGFAQENSGAMEQMKKIIEEMKKVEEEINKMENADVSKIKQTQEKIEEKLLEFNRSLKPKEKQDDERKSEREDELYKIKNKTFLDDDFNDIIKLRDLKNKSTYPKEYEERINAYMKALEKLIE